MQKYCYSKDIVVSIEELLTEFDIEAFFNLYQNSMDRTALKRVLTNFRVFLEDGEYEDCQFRIRLIADAEKKQIYKLPNVSNRYYDKNNQLISRISCPGIGSVLSLEGEIFENLDLNTQEKVDEFCQENGYSNMIYPGTIACIHLRGREYNKAKKESFDEMLKHMHVDLSDLDNPSLMSSDIGTNPTQKSLTEREKQIIKQMQSGIVDTKDLYIIKNTFTYMMYYNAPYIYNNIENQANFSIEELAQIQAQIRAILILTLGKDQKDYELLRVDPERNGNEKFLEYTLSILEQYESIVENRGRNIQKEVFDEKSKKVLENLLLYPENKTIYCKLNIISDHEIVPSENKNLQLLKKYSKCV